MIAMGQRVIGEGLAVEILMHGFILRFEGEDMLRELKK